MRVIKNILFTVFIFEDFISFGGWRDMRGFFIVSLRFFVSFFGGGSCFGLKFFAFKIIR